MTAYYYSGGNKVALHRDLTRVAVSSSHPMSSGLKASLEKGRRLAGDVVLVDASELPKGALAEMEHAGAVYPVFVDNATTLVALPEVRVEIDSSNRSALMNALKTSPVEGKITEERDDTLVLAPVSGSGADALTLANHLAESKPSPRMAAARLLRVMARPEPKR